MSARSCSVDIKTLFRARQSGGRSIITIGDRRRKSWADLSWNSDFWPHEYTLNSCGQPKPKTAVWIPPASVFTPPMLTSQPTTPSSQIHYFFLRQKVTQKMPGYTLSSGFLSERTAPTPTSKASPSTINCRPVSGLHRIGSASITWSAERWVPVKVPQFDYSFW